MTKTLEWLGRNGSVIAWDVIGLVGAALVAWGSHEVYEPAGYIVGGLLLVGGSFLSARNRG